MSERVELFSVYQFFPDDRYERVRYLVLKEEALKAFDHYTTCAAARLLGIPRRVIITDSGDCLYLEWHNPVESQL